MKFAATMTLGIAAIFFAMLIIASAIPAYSEETESTAIDGVTLNQAAKGTYRMYRGDSFICSGVFVKSTDEEDLFLTAAHCGSGKPLSVKLEKYDSKFKMISEQTFYLQPVRTLKKLDVMVFKTLDPSTTWNISPIATQEESDAIEFGMPLVAIGYPMGKEITMTRGDFQNRVKPLPKDMDQEEPVFKVTVPVTGGSSGGGFWLKTGTGYKLVGLTSHGFSRVSFMNYAATTKSLHRVTRNLLK